MPLITVTEEPDMFESLESVDKHSHDAQEMLQKKKLEHNQFVFVGKHSATKVCGWTKKALRGEGGCYKQKFYGIQSHQCVQMTPTMTCNQACVFCWRDLNSHTTIGMGPELDEPEAIIEGSIKGQLHMIAGFKGHTSADLKKFNEAQRVKHFAISLDGEPTLYPQLSELITQLHKRDISTFVVTNGTMPNRIAELLETPPTQLYVSVDAPTKELYLQIDRPMINDGWERLMKTLSMLPQMKEKTRTVMRFTVIKGLNDFLPEKWAEIVTLAQPLFLEVKSYMWIGPSKERLDLKNMMSHDDIKQFGLAICKHSGYKLVDEHEGSRVVLLMKEDRADRVMRF